MNDFVEYEVMFIVDAVLEAEAVKTVVEKFTNLIGENGELVNIDEWGKRKLAYPINHKLEGYYFIVAFKSAPQFPAELERVFRITDSILRFLVINTDNNK